ncbi:hypothetical protein [Bifidobacterium sp. ESL0745]|uniref:hypothetical protein n=1 Tax=Bifidobacterium sp. ESL0745 TaxID=2983226 RepID=UPI0023F88E43|nr:hypothetical protein [Bifidobacterium sp. ESL0745]MDF7665708.1 hypothetical protein [Bifidobacterium sp. ESL0745]
MRTTRIITAKIEPQIYRLILDGTKTSEVRDEPFNLPLATRSTMTPMTMRHFRPRPRLGLRGCA